MTRRRIAALCEVLGVYLVGQLVMALLIRALGLEVTNPLTTLTVTTSDAELVDKTHQLVGLLALQYAGWFLLIAPVYWWRSRASAADYGFTRAGHSWGWLAGAGVVTWAAAALPTRALEVANAAYGLGSTAPWRQALFDMSWTRWQFWYFTAMGSYLLIPVIEELFYRGYCQRRLAEDWGDGAAILGVSALFAFSHGQYLQANAYSSGMLAGTMVSAIGFGVVFAATRSLWPAIMAHALINVPATPRWMVVLLVVMAAIAWRWRASVVTALRRVFTGIEWSLATVVALVGAGYAIAAARVEALALVALVLFAVGVVLGRPGAARAA